MKRWQQIRGHTNDNECQWLHSQALCRTTIVEIGVYLGRSTAALATGMADDSGRVYGIDTWQGGPAERDKWHPEFVTVEGQDTYYLEALKNLHGLPVTLIRAPSERAYVLFNNIKIDMLFIDGGHDYNSVFRDIQLYQQYMAEGGLISGHDYNGNWPDVIRAVNDSFGKKNIQRGPNSIWFKEYEFVTK